MYELLHSKVKEVITISEAEFELCKTLFIPKKLRKKQYLLQEGDVCKNIAFVEKGALRAYTVNNDGVEHIMQFALEGWYISDLYSFLTGEVATYNIDAIEDSESVLISRSAHDELLKKYPKYETFTRELITGAYVALQKRLNSIISKSLEERYEAFISLYPDIAKRVPQHMIASYMGLTPETLSRVRKKMVRK